MKNSQLIRICGIVSLVCFLLFPVAGCGPMNVSGLDILTETEMDMSVKFFIILSLCCAVALIFLKDKVQLFFSAIAGLFFLLFSFLVAKLKSRTGNGFDLFNAIELKVGFYMSILGFIAAAIISKIKKDLFNQPPETTEQKPGEEQPHDPIV